MSTFSVNYNDDYIRSEPELIPVSSNIGTTPVISTETLADFAETNLSIDNSIFLTSNTAVTYTKQAQYTKKQLIDADNAYVNALNVLSGFRTSGDTTSADYHLAKSNAFSVQRQFELVRDQLEIVTVSDSNYIGQAQLYTGPDYDTLNSFASDSQYYQAAPLYVGPTNTDDNLLSIGTSGLEEIDLSTGDVPVTTSGDIVSDGIKGDVRIRLRPKATDYDLIYGDESSVLYGLRKTKGVFFPYTPEITYSNKVAYTNLALTHANTDYYIYQNTPAVQLTITGKFTAQNLEEAQYTLMAMHFFRTVRNMRFGINDDDRGLPPPVLILSGYGDFMFNDLNVLMLSFDYGLPDNVDYIEVPIGDGVAMVPTMTTISISCVVQQTPIAQKNDFNFKDFASGSLITNQKGWI